MFDASDPLDDVLSDIGPVAIHPRSRGWLEEHVNNIALSVEDMNRCPTGGLLWGHYRDFYVHSVAAPEAALGVEGASRPLARIEIAIREGFHNPLALV